jgi:hypothetical protein
MVRYWNDYVPDLAAWRNPLAVPMLADLSRLPPLYVAACELPAAGSIRASRRAGWIDAMGPEVDPRQLDQGLGADQ